MRQGRSSPSIPERCGGKAQPCSSKELNFMREIPLTQGKVALVDDEDYERVARLSWRAHYSKGTWYAETGGGEDVVAMHSFILGLPRGSEADHKDRDGLNNCRENIRPATRSNNCMNRQGWSRHGFKGVYKVSTGLKYGARIQEIGRASCRERV